MKRTTLLLLALIVTSTMFAGTLIIDKLRLKTVLTSEEGGQLLQQMHIDKGTIMLHSNSVTIRGYAEGTFPLDVVTQLANLPNGFTLDNLVIGNSGTFQRTTNGFEVYLFVKP